MMELYDIPSFKYYDTCHVQDEIFLRILFNDKGPVDIPWSVCVV